MLTGGCRCGAVTYSLANDAAPLVYCCHCLDCQKSSGSAFAEQAIIRETDIHAAGPLVRFEVTGRQGIRSVQYGCGICHSRIYNTNVARPGIAILRAGTLDQTRALRPRLHIWVASKQAWLTLPRDVETFDRSPPPEHFRALLLEVQTQQPGA